jgi:hypothetical protein
MKRTRFYPIRQADQITWLVNFYAKLPDYAVTLGLAPAQVTAIVADCKWIVYVLQSWLSGVRTWAQSATDAAADAQTGSGSSVLVLPVFTAPPLPSGTVAVLPGALTRVLELVQDIKDSGKSTEVISTNLGIIGTEMAGPDYVTLQVDLGATVSGNMVNLRWGWGGNRAFLDACEIQVDRNDGKGFVLLTIDTTPNYTDTQPWPASRTVWTYRAIYRKDDRQVGVWSSLVSVTVG